MILIRKMLPEDAKKASLLEKECFSQPWSKEAFDRALKNPNAYYIVAEDSENLQNEMIGMCGVLNVLGEGEITNVAVKNMYRGQKIAQQMLEELLTEGKKLGIKAFTLEVRSQNISAIHIYEKLGFFSVGIRKNFYNNPKEDALIMWKDRHLLEE